MAEVKLIRRRHHLPQRLYQLPGGYFVTVCTYQRRTTLAQITGDAAVLSPLGSLVDSCWSAIPEHLQLVKLDSYVVMPNHVHGIILLGCFENPIALAELPTIQVLINSFKSSVTRLARKAGLWGPSPLWQNGYWDHVIRDEDSLNRIREYIQQNPLAWHLDCENSQRTGINEIYQWMESFRVRPVSGQPTTS